VEKKYFSAIKKNAAKKVDPSILMTDRGYHFRENNKKGLPVKSINWQPLYMKGAVLAPRMSCSGETGFG
jgi:uncharacterized protein YfaS (alpha-2-macroglobulin family)